jgi:hypothetical protein
MNGSCRFAAQAAMIRHLAVEKISLTPDFYESDNHYRQL